MITLKLNECYILEGRVYRLCWTNWKNGKEQGNRALLKLLNNKELNELILNSGENTLNTSERGLKE